MATFDMRGQKVTNQYNAGRDINFGTIQSPIDLIAELEKLKGELARAKDDGFISEETVVDAEYQVTKAVQQIKKPEPDKKSILDHLITAKAFIENATAISGLVTALASAIEVVHKLF